MTITNTTLTTEIELLKEEVEEEACEQIHKIASMLKLRGELCLSDEYVMCLARCLEANKKMLECQQRVKRSLPRFDSGIIFRQPLQTA